MKPQRPITGRVRLARLRNLLRVMEEVEKNPPRAYCIVDPGIVYPSRAAMAKDLCISEEDTPPCHTVACTGGWAACDLWFQRRGWKLTRHRLRVPGMPRGVMLWSSLHAWFGLDYEDGVTLFRDGPQDKYGFRMQERTRPRHIVTRLKALIRKYEKVPS